MSHSKDSARDQWSEESNARYAELQQMIAGGRSFSGNERHCAFLNTGNSDFSNVSALSGIDLPDDGRALALSDWDGDGDVDLWISNRTGPQLRLFRNNTDAGANSIGIRLIGNGTSVNRDAIGTRIELAGQIRTTRAGEGFLTQSSNWQHFGLGKAGSPGTITIRWPDDTVQTFDGLKINSRYTITQGEAQAVDEKIQPRKLIAGEQDAPQAEANARIFLRSPIPLPKVGFQTFDGRNVLLPAGDGKPLLIAFWASWCTPCQIELEELSKRSSDLDSAGLRVIALAVNGIGSDQSKPADAFELAQKYLKKFAFGMATEGLLNDFQYLTDLAVSLPRTIPLPSSFLIDGEGRIAAIYKGPVDPDQLLTDLRSLELPATEHFEAAALVPGRAIELPEVRKKSALTNARIYLQLAKTAKRSKRPDTAATYYQQALRFNPNHAESHLELASLAKARRESTTALQHLQSAVKIHPQYAEAHRRLGELFSGSGDIPKAIEHYKLAIEIYPGDVPSMNNLAWILATTEASENRDGALALNFANQAIAIAGQRADLLDTLAAAYAETGDLTKAIATVERAITLAKDANQEPLRKAIEKSLRAYQIRAKGP